MPFDGAAQDMKAVVMLDALLEFFDGGRRWIQGRFGDRKGNHCLVGAMNHLRAVRGISGAGIKGYMREAMCDKASGMKKSTAAPAGPGGSSTSRSTQTLVKSSRTR